MGKQVKTEEELKERCVEEVTDMWFSKSKQRTNLINCANRIARIMIRYNLDEEDAIAVCRIVMNVVDPSTQYQIEEIAF